MIDAPTLFPIDSIPTMTNTLQRSNPSPKNTGSEGNGGGEVGVKESAFGKDRE